MSPKIHRPARGGSAGASDRRTRIELPAWDTPTREELIRRVGRMFILSPLADLHPVRLGVTTRTICEAWPAQAPTDAAALALCAWHDIEAPPLDPVPFVAPVPPPADPPVKAARKAPAKSAKTSAPPAPVAVEPRAPKPPKRAGAWATPKHIPTRKPAINPCLAISRPRLKCAATARITHGTCRHFAADHIQAVRCKVPKPAAPMIDQYPALAHWTQGDGWVRVRRLCEAVVMGKGSVAAPCYAGIEPADMPMILDALGVHSIHTARAWATGRFADLIEAIRHSPGVTVRDLAHDWVTTPDTPGATARTIAQRTSRSKPLRDFLARHIPQEDTTP